ncbi:MAG: GAF domain-containing sensor histidine kinase, partial [Rhodanobacteraceae bacterium]
PPRQAQRLAALRSYDILDTPVEGAFEDITRIAALVCRVTIAAVNLIDENRQWFKSEIGLGVREMPLDALFCAHALLQNEFMEIPDARLDPRFRHNPLVMDGPHLRFYAGALIRTAEGFPLGTVCVMDTRPRRLNEEQRHVLRALARQAMTQLELRRTMIVAARAHRYRGRLMAIAGHDLKQPLTTMTMVLDMLPAPTPADRRRIDVAKEAAARLREELDGLSRASRLDEDADAIELESLQIDELIAEVADSWLRAAKDKGLGLQVRVIDAAVRTHAGMLRAMLDNLVGNAIKYTTHGSVTIACREADGDLWIDVADTGKGIPEDRRDEMFTAFRQLDPDTDGLGLGLSIVKSTADILGYRLSLECGEGRGATFSVCLPRQRPETANAVP